MPQGDCLMLRHPCRGWFHQIFVGINTATPCRNAGRQLHDPSFHKRREKDCPKVGEEAVESVVEAVDGNRDRFTYEACDLIYHLLVLIEQMGISLPELERELLKRHS